MPNDFTSRTDQPAIIRLHRFGSGLLTAVISLGLWTALLAVLFRSQGSPVPDWLVAITVGAGAVVTTRTMVRDLFGKLIIDPSRVELTPRASGFRWWWSEISMWYLEGDSSMNRSSSFLLWRSGYDSPRRVPAKWFAVSDRERVHQAFQNFGREKKRRY